MTSILSIGSSEIRELDGLFSLNDLHKAAGGEVKHQPAFFIRRDEAKALIAEIGNSANSQSLRTVTGRNGGTYVCKELVIAYAAWISAAFHLKVIRVFLAQGHPAEAAKPAPMPVPPLSSVGITGRKWILSIDGGSESLTPIDPDSVAIKLADLPSLIRAPNSPFSVAQLSAIGQACLEQMACRFQDMSSQAAQFAQAAQAGQAAAAAAAAAARHESVDVKQRLPLSSAAASMNENLRKKLELPNISFWNAATEIVSMRHQLDHERGEVLSCSQFASVLASQGLKVDRATLAMYEFAVKHYANFEHRNEITRDNIRYELRPGYTLLRGLWEKQNKVGLFDPVYLQWVALVVLPTYSVTEFQSSLNACAAKALGYSSEKFSALWGEEFKSYSNARAVLQAEGSWGRNRVASLADLPDSPDSPESMN